ncbi:acyltransferase family protein [Streptomyces polyrhachis]|uniref:Acyltransferase family protein n=1 Tax=Streptomyces polyrhachis TaxID=1282885 RepID=A0ABW2G8C7_9ACTN
MGAASSASTDVKPEEAAAPGAGRDPFFDNAKYLAIVLVALGHAWSPLTSGSRTAAALYLVVYAFHMPAFILISGYFSRSFDASPKRVRSLLTGIAVPYLIFETAYSLFHRWAAHEPDFALSPQDPWYLTWFLLSLFVWRLTTPIWKVVRWPVPLALAVAASATLNPTILNDLDLQRVLQFLPFFVLGLVLRPEHFELVRRRAVRIAAVPVFAAALVTAYWAAPRLTTAWFARTASSVELGQPTWVGPLATLAMFALGIVLTACFLAWVPRRHLWFTALGSGTLYGYLLHGFLVQSSREWDWYAPAWVHTPGGAVAVTVIAAVVVTALCTAPVRWLFRWAVEPRMQWAFRKPAATATPSATPVRIPPPAAGGTESGA